MITPPGGLKIVISALAQRRVSNYQLGAWSRDEYADPAAVQRIQAWCDSVFGTHMEDCAYMMTDPHTGSQQIVVGPTIAEKLRRACPSGRTD